MIGWLYRMLIGSFAMAPPATCCPHEWDTIEKTEYGRPNGDIVGTLFVLRCRKCGDIKHHRASVYK